jgi:2-succinyl-5-enolpyruvyl-6-hydroxy-3-cyclohexene-1-carboxylate synthase
VRPEHVTHAWVSTLLDQLGRAGVRHAVACPGSRSTPVAMLLAGRSDIRLWMHLDERSAAFFGLGLARGLGEPVALLCTSGTAAANFLPAVAEANLSRAPLVVLTADRPPELREIGAPQTMDQVRLYGAHVKWAVDLPLPEATPEALRYVSLLASRAAATAMSAPAGPVHLNLPFREPLVPLADPDEVPSVLGSLSREQAQGSEQPPLPRAEEGEQRPPLPLGEGWGEGSPDGDLGRPRVAVMTGPAAPEPALVGRLAMTLAGQERGLIVCGPGDSADLGPDVATLARALGYPILADPLSGVRAGPHDRSLVLDAYDAFLRDERVAAALAPDVVIRFGAIPTSKPLTQYLERHAAARHILVDGGRGWRDPSLLAGEVLHVDPRQLCLTLAQALTMPTVPIPWLDRWLRVDRRARATIAEHLAGLAESFEGRVFADLAELLPDGATLVAGNSMPVRDLDTFFPSTAKRVRFLANRGGNGIDGVVSTALGVGAAGAQPLVLVIGDISFYHDLNGLLAAKQHGLDATVVLLNNDGGGIFSFLPQAAYPEQFELLFGTPHGLDFRPAVEMYGGRFERADAPDDFRAALGRALASAGLAVIEVVTDRARNVAQHRAIWPLVAAAVAEELAEAPAAVGVGTGAGA